MTYTGDVESGGPSDRRDPPAADDPQGQRGGTMANNVYLLTCARHGRARCSSTPRTSPARITTLLRRGRPAGPSPSTTHRHWDHHRALAQVVASDKPERRPRRGPCRRGRTSRHTALWRLARTATRLEDSATPYPRASSTSGGTRRDRWRWPTTTRTGTAHSLDRRLALPGRRRQRRQGLPSASPR